MTSSYKITNLFSGKTAIVEKSQVSEFTDLNKISPKQIVSVEEVLTN